MCVTEYEGLKAWFVRSRELGRSEIYREVSMNCLGAVAEEHMGRNCRFSIQLNGGWKVGPKKFDKGIIGILFLWTYKLSNGFVNSKSLFLGIGIFKVKFQNIESCYCLGFYSLFRSKEHICAWEQVRFFF